MNRESITKRLNASSLDAKSKREVQAILQAILHAVSGMAAKLDADAGVTDTDYQAKVSAIVGQ